MAAGFRRLPDDIKAQIDSMGDSPFVFGTVRKFNAEWHEATIATLHLTEVGGDVHQGLPPTTLGRWSGWNVNGWIKVWKNLPKVNQTFTHEVPNYNGNGWHDISRTREVWQKSRWFGQQLEAQLSHDDEAADISIAIVRKVMQGPFTEEFEHEFRYAASLSREWFGDVRVLPLGEDGVPDIPTDSLSWELLPPGTLEEVREYVKRKYGASVPPQEIEIMIDRFEKVESLHPETRLIGTSGLQRYIGYKFGPDFVAFENPRVGNALYVLHGHWQELSQLSRTELLASRQGEFDRIIHTAKWFDRLRVIVHDYRSH